ncbi:MAG: hypothetical protein HLUCCA08_07005 [Rhodobacteraceae bacterium HLUCCA08]|nr:MAG: hypothetical protein HLUCCA08_07005 [Rhodobacteraceae bacterium HLUCCA08]
MPDTLTRRIDPDLHGTRDRPGVVGAVPIRVLRIGPFPAIAASATRPGGMA